jgi:hypothetical protein
VLHGLQLVCNNPYRCWRFLLLLLLSCPAIHSDYLAVLGSTLAAIPDFRWGAATNAETDKDGYAIVTVTATGE